MVRDSKTKSVPESILLTLDSIAKILLQNSADVDLNSLV